MTPYGFAAHAFGAIDGRLYTNSLEAFQRNYGRGFRVFEVDLVRLADGTALLAHDGLEANYGLNKPFTEATWADLAGHKYLGRYTILRVQELARLLRQHPDMYVILDLQVRPARHLPAHAAARARTQPARAHLPRRGPGRAERAPHRLPGAELHAGPVPHPGLEPLRRPSWATSPAGTGRRR